jgi:hypothetical protein
VGVGVAIAVVAVGDIAEGTGVEVATAVVAVGVFATGTGDAVGSGSLEHATPPPNTATSATRKNIVLNETSHGTLMEAPLGALK